MDLFIPVLLGSGREGRESEKAAKFILETAKKYGKFETELIDVRDYLQTPWTEEMPDEKAKKWSDIMTRADGLVVVSPEYNHGYPGELKLMLDQIFDEYKHKPIGICGVSSGPVGGARMIQALRAVAVALQMVPVKNAVFFPNIASLFDEQGNIKDPSYENRAIKLFDEVVWYARALKNARAVDK